ncbi:DNA (cytosine-5-)-methyltransferase [Sneathia sanguinegens]|uniref:Cytosine-specific methyltransferase n=1 Tax=Sneathia sanguinegens TaxID=40543 RepID=A0ABT7HJQ5_9FUSO|nr:DNA (cytosine-5-)-methyltransferase [Sneathia sanguinegens]MDK9580759.1 DNA (cytosine-5-)-methyltransferase [Sneathia sanguinegens]
MYKMASLFAGVGGIDIGFEMTGKFKTVWANENDKNARLTYSKNFDVEINDKDIRDVKNDEMPDIDILLSGFPCTSFSIAGYRKGFEDERTGDLFFETLRFIVAKKPKIVFLENVKNLVSHDDGKTFRIIKDSLEKNGYKIKYQVLNAKDYGNIPQNRERIYIIGFRDEKVYQNFEFPFPLKLTKSIKDMFEDKIVDSTYFYTKEKNKFFDILINDITEENTIYQWRRKYVRENKSNVCPTLTANMGTGGHNVPLIKTKYGIRKLTPRECFNFQGFPKSFILPNIANSHLYKQAGNSVVVSVINRIAQNILRAIENEERKHMITHYTVCYIEKDDEILMLYRNKKKNDINKGKWLGVGGHIEEGESPYECVVREIKEETGLEVKKVRARGFITFIYDGNVDYIHVFSTTEFSGELIECDEGDLKWIKREDILNLNIWESDRYLLSKIVNKEYDYFMMTSRFENMKLIEQKIELG